MRRGAKVNNVGGLIIDFECSGLVKNMKFILLGGKTCPMDLITLDCIHNLTEVRITCDKVKRG